MFFIEKLEIIILNIFKVKDIDVPIVIVFTDYIWGWTKDFFRFSVVVMEKIIFDNLFHKKYVGGEGEIAEIESAGSTTEFRGMTLADVLFYYRLYIGDKKAELPQEVLEQLRLVGKI